MEGRVLCRIMSGAMALLALLTAGCPTSSEGIDLTERGVLNLVISRVSESAVATATAQVSDSNILSIPYSKIVLADDQILSINDVPLTATTRTALGLDATVAATIEAADPPDTYTISFDNQGVTTMLVATPPEDFSEVTPESSTEVPRDGFELTWEPSGDDDVTISITITGLVVSYAEDGSLQTAKYTVSLSDLADDGDITIGATELYQFFAGEITVTLTRRETISQKLGFSSGTIGLEIEREIPLILVDPAT